MLDRSARRLRCRARGVLHDARRPLPLAGDDHDLQRVRPHQLVQRLRRHRPRHGEQPLRHRAGGEGRPLRRSSPAWPGLDRWDRMDHSVDFRSMYASVLDGWMGGGASTVLGGSFPDLGLFKQTPRPGVGGGSAPTSVLGDFVGVTPVASTTRAPTRWRKLPLGAGTTGEVQVLGAGGVPASGVTAVALNVTATGATGASNFTVWPAGDVKPADANLLMPASRSVPNLVIVKVGAAGRVNVTNDLGSAHCIVDVVGYFRTTAGNRPAAGVAVPCARHPQRHRRADGPDRSQQQLRRAWSAASAACPSGVPTRWWSTSPPSGRRRTAASRCGPPVKATRNASSLNYVAGQTVPNLVITKVGANGKISIYNDLGATHFIVDILGYFIDGAVAATSRWHPDGCSTLVPGSASRWHVSAQHPRRSRSPVPTAYRRAVSPRCDQPHRRRTVAGHVRDRVSERLGRAQCVEPQPAAQAVRVANRDRRCRRRREDPVVCGRATSTCSSTWWGTSPRSGQSRPPNRVRPAGRVVINRAAGCRMASCRGIVRLRS